jgi:hypothetical protein
MKSKDFMIKLLMKRYTSKHDMKIEVFFKHVNWYKLLRAWDLYPSFHAASGLILELKRKQKEIKNMWHDNPTLSLPALLSSMGLLPPRVLKKVREGNTDWYFASIDDLFHIMGIAGREYFIWCSGENMFGFKRKYPKCKFVKDLSSRYIRKILKFKHSKRFQMALIAELERRGKTL